MKRNENFKMNFSKDSNNPNATTNNNVTTQPYVPTQYYHAQHAQHVQHAQPTTQGMQPFVPTSSQPAVPIISTQPIMVENEHQFPQAFVPQQFASQTMTPQPVTAVAATTGLVMPQQQQQQTYPTQPAYNPQYNPSQGSQQQQHQPYVATPTAPYNPTMSRPPQNVVPQQPPPPLSNKSAWFDYYDRDFSGRLNKDELIRGVVETLSIPYGSSQYNDISNTINSIWAVFDTDQSGSIEKHEFCSRDGFGECLQQAMITHTTPSSSSTPSFNEPKPFVPNEINNDNTTVPLNPSMKKVRVGIPQGLSPGREVALPMPDGKTKIVLIPDRSKWVYLNTGQPAFDIEIPASDSAAPHQKTTKIRVGIPQGSSPGKQVRVKTPAGTTTIVKIPDRSKWIYLNTGQPAFDIQVPVVESETSYGGTNQTSIAQNTPSQSSALPPWKKYEDIIPASYQPPPLGLRPASVTPQPKMNFIQTTGRRRALIIGINYTGTRAALRGCINDARNMKNLLVQNQFPNDSSHMLMLVDDAGTPSNYQPTYANIFKAMQWLMQGVRKGDVLFFHFSGHGAQQPDRTGHEADGLNETILPLDFRNKGQITDDQLWGSLVYPLPAGARLTALMDCCHSGTGLDLPFEYQMSGYREGKNRFGLSTSIRNDGQWVEDVNPAHSQGDVVLFSGCQDNQTSADTYSNSNTVQAGGAMTQSFISAFQSNPYSTYPEFLSAIHKSLRNRRFSQRPQLTSSQPFNAKERIFSFAEGIEPNYNSQVGRVKKRHVRPGKMHGNGGDGIGPMGAVLAGLGALAIGDAIFDF